MCDCNKTTNISMGCCQPVLGPVEAYYTKFTIDRKLEEITSAITSGCCITPEEVDEKIASAKTEIEAEIPSLDGYATEQWVEDKHYITGVDLSDYSTTEQMNNVITAATDGLATTAYVNTQISAETGDFIDGEELSSYTYDKATIDDKIASGGTFDPTLYYKKTETSGSTEISNALNLKADTTAVTQVNNDLTAHTADTGVHVTSTEKTTWNSKQDVLTAGTGVNISGNVISMKIWSGTKAQFDAITVKDNETIYLVTD